MKQRQFDSTAAGEARDDAMRRVEIASQDFVEDAVAILWRLAAQAPELTGDDIWEAFFQAGGSPPDEPRAMGPVFMRGKKEGVIAPTMVFRKCRRVSRHGAPVRVWRSLIHGK